MVQVMLSYLLPTLELTTTNLEGVDNAPLRFLPSLYSASQHQSAKSEPNRLAERLLQMGGI